MSMVSMAANGDVGAMRKKLASNPDCVDDQDEDGDSAFTWGAIKGDVEICTLLLQAGANPNIQNSV